MTFELNRQLMITFIRASSFNFITRFGESMHKYTNNLFFVEKRISDHLVGTVHINIKYKMFIKYFSGSRDIKYIAYLQCGTK